MNCWHKNIILFLVLSLMIFLVGCGESSEKSATQPDTPPLHTYYVATNGDDSNPGTIDQPFKSWSKAWSVVVAGDLVYVRGGIYYPDPTKSCSVVLRGKNGLPGKYIRFFAYPGETPILDYSNVTYVGYTFAINFTGDYCHFKGLEITGVSQSVDPSTGHGYGSWGFVANDSNNNIFENINIHHIGGVGFALTGNSNNNLISNSDFHHNYDPYTYTSTGVPYPGGNADGCNIGSIPKGCQNVVSGCRFWWNSDDGIDLWENEGIVIIQNSWSFWNGYQPGTFVTSGDGNGFKLGRTVGASDDTTQRVVENCVAYANLLNGFDQNAANVLMTFYNNTSYRNGGLGFQLSDYPLQHVIKNNISYANYSGQIPDYQLSAVSYQTNNSWNGSSVTDADFVSIDAAGFDGTRRPDGSLPDISFLSLAITSGLIDKGVNVGLPFTGIAPDLGAFEAQ